MLAEAFAPRGTHPDDLSLARRILSHDASERILAGALRDDLGARPTVKDEAAAARRAGPTPKRVEAAPARGPRASRRASRARRGLARRRPRDERPREERPRDERPRDEAARESASRALP